MFLEHSGTFLQRSYVSFLSTSSEEDEGTALNSQTLCFFIGGGGGLFRNGQNEPPSYKLFLMDRICDFSFQILNCSYRNYTTTSHCPSQYFIFKILAIYCPRSWIKVATRIIRRWVYYKNKFNVWHLTRYVCKCLWIKMKRSSI